MNQKLRIEYQNLVKGYRPNGVPDLREKKCYNLVAFEPEIIAKLEGLSLAEQNDYISEAILEKINREKAKNENVRKKCWWLPI